MESSAMTKILEGYRKLGGGKLELADLLRPAGAISLFPSPQEAQQKEFSRLANRMLDLKARNLRSVFAVAASMPGEGASFVSYHLACALARDYAQKVVWVDANYLSPQRALQDAGPHTLCALLQDPERGRELPVDPSPVLVPGGEKLQSVRGLLTDEPYPAMLAVLAERFDFCLLDLPPLLKSTDCALMASRTSGLLLVIEQKYLKWEVLKEGVRAMQDMGVEVIGSVINRRRYDLPKFLYDRL